MVKNKAPNMKLQSLHENDKIYNSLIIARLLLGEIIRNAKEK